MHTKGPCEVGYHSTGGRRDGAVVFQADEKGDVVWNVATLWANGRAIEECDANARLISASPDLLEFAKLARLELSQIHAHHYPGCEDGCPTHAILHGLDAAIAKAEGGK